jgi:GNAT superfamily N-acetyltransferase
MNGTEARRYPRTITAGGADVVLRSMRAGDEAAMLAFARELPVHDLLFLPRDIRHPKVLDAWVGEIERGAMISLLAVRGNDVLGNVTIVRDPLSWSPHVGELRVVVARSVRGTGLGRVLIEDASLIAIGLGVKKLVAHMTADQTGAIALFETMGYQPEALLRNHVKDREGRKYDLVILSHDVEAVRAGKAASDVDGTAE